MTLTETADRGEILDTLRALRHKLTDALDKSESGRDIAALSLQLQKVLAEINELEKAERLNQPDELDAIIAAHQLQRLHHGYTNDFEDDAAN